MGNVHQPSICFVIPRYVTFSTGGAEIQVYYLVNELLKRGWKVELICGGKGYDNDIINSPFTDRRVRFLYYRFCIIRFLEFFGVLRLLFKTRSDIYYQRTDFALTGACALYCRLMRKKMIYALALDNDAEKNKYRDELQYYSYKSILKKWIRKIDFFLVDKMVEAGKRWSHSIVCQNKKQQKKVEESFYRDSIIIPSSFPYRSDPSVNKEKIVIWVGNMSFVKRPDLFVQMFHHLIRKDGWRFVMIGKVNDDVLRCDTKGIEVKGELSYKETLTWFDRAKVLINTSSVEGMPNTFIQAWIKKVLVVSLSVDPDGLLSQQQLGFVFDDDLRKLTSFINDYLGFEKECQDVLDKANAFTLETYDVKKNVDRLIQLMAG